MICTTFPKEIPTICWIHGLWTFLSTSTLSDASRPFHMVSAILVDKRIAYAVVCVGKRIRCAIFVGKRIFCAVLLVDKRTKYYVQYSSTNELHMRSAIFVDKRMPHAILVDKQILACDMLCNTRRQTNILLYNHRQTIIFCCIHRGDRVLGLAIFVGKRILSYSSANE